MAEARRRPSRRAEREGEGARGIIRVEAGLAEENLFKQLALQILEAYAPEEFETRIESMPRMVAKLVHIITKEYFSTPLGGQILDPRYSRDIVIDRVCQFMEVLLNVHRRYIEELLQNIQYKKMKGEEFRDELAKILNNFKIIYIVARELMNRLLVLSQINLPAPVRPPLANVKLGFEIV